MSKPVAASITGVRFQDFAFVVVGSFLVALSAQFAIPLPWTPVPVTLQPLAVLLVGAFLGPWRGAAAMFLYLLEGAAGLPVFTPMGAPGLARLLGPTGGYLMSYPFAAYLIGHFADRGWTKTFKLALPAFLLTSFVILFFGGAWMVLGGSRTLSEALMLGVLPFLPWDFLKILFAASLTSLVARKRK
ncbi:MAG: biotin transporter BioY [Acidobacteria bacterium]|nr:biotin transporter BioY [Acidobacteriota bacterium]